MHFVNYILLSLINWEIIRGIFITFLLFFGPGIIYTAYRNNKTKKAIAARGGIRKIYSELFDAIRQMPENRIRTDHPTSVTATYLNGSKKRCKINVFVIDDCTYVTFFIMYQDKWVTISNKQYYGNLSGNQLLLRIIFDFPDCDLSICI